MGVYILSIGGIHLWDEILKILSKNSFNSYLIALFILMFGAFVITILDRFLKSKVKKLEGDPKYEIIFFSYSIFKKTFFPLIYYGLLIATFSSLEIPEGIEKLIEYTGIILFTIASIRFINSVIDYWLRILTNKKDKTTSQIQGMKGLLSVLKISIWGLGFLIAAQNMGYIVSTAVAGFGITGIAVVFAAQSLLGDLFSYFSILFDKPFEPGDFVIIGNMMGTIQHIGIKTTRMISLTGEQLIISNGDLTSSRLKNYKRMKRRRIAFKIGVVYSLAHDQLKEIPLLFEKIVKETKNVSFDRAHFVEYGPYSLNFEVVYYVNSKDYLDYMDAHQSINLEIKRIFDEKGINFAFPTQTIQATMELENQNKTKELI
jgi:small-conductance mechanosensitive channel